MVCMTAFRTLFVGDKKFSNPSGGKVVKAPIQWSNLKAKAPSNQYVKLTRIFRADSGNIAHEGVHGLEVQTKDSGIELDSC